MISYVYRKLWLTRESRQYHGKKAFYPTCRRCALTDDINKVRVFVHDNAYPWKNVSPNEVPSVSIWSEYSEEFFFHDELWFGGDQYFNDFYNKLANDPEFMLTYWAVPITMIILICCTSLVCLVSPLLGHPVVFLTHLVYRLLSHNSHRRFWRSVMIKMELWRRKRHRWILPVALDHAIDVREYMVPRYFRENVDEGEPKEILDFQGTICVYIEDDSDSQCERSKLYSYFYNNEGVPKTSKLKGKEAIISLEKDAEFRNEIWYHIQNLRLQASERRYAQLKRDRGSLSTDVQLLSPHNIPALKKKSRVTKRSRKKRLVVRHSKAKK